MSGSLLAERKGAAVVRGAVHPRTGISTRKGTGAELNGVIGG